MGRLAKGTTLLGMSPSLLFVWEVGGQERRRYAQGTMWCLRSNPGLFYAMHWPSEPSPDLNLNLSAWSCLSLSLCIITGPKKSTALKLHLEGMGLITGPSSSLRGMRWFHGYKSVYLMPPGAQGEEYMSPHPMGEIVKQGSLETLTNHLPGGFGEP